MLVSTKTLGITQLRNLFSVEGNIVDIVSDFHSQSENQRHKKIHTMLPQANQHSRTQVRNLYRY